MNVYAGTARFDTGRALTEDELHELAPSVFAHTAHESRSERFAPIPTIEVIKGLQKEGFSVVGARQSLTRMPGRGDFTKHLLRLRRLDDSSKYKVGDTVFEMLLKNANDGTCCYDLLAGLFRIMCMNSMVANAGTLDTVRVRHSGDVKNKVIEGTYSVLQQSERALAAPAEWSTINLVPEERTAFAEAAHALRFPETSPIKPEQLLRPRRAAEQGKTDLWSTFNVLQENIIKGGVHATGPDAQNRMRRMTSRRINGIDQDVKLNKALWIVAERMKELHP